MEVRDSDHSATSGHDRRAEQEKSILFRHAAPLRDTPADMSSFFGLIVGLASACLTWLVLQPLTAQLPSEQRVVSLAVAVGVAVLAGFLAGGAIVRRAVRRKGRIVLFTGLASAVAGGIMGSCTAVVLTAAYLVSYGHPPADLSGRIIYVLAVPASGGLGWFVGAALGLLVGLTGGALLRVTTLRPR